MVWYIRSRILVIFFFQNQLKTFLNQVLIDLNKYPVEIGVLNIIYDSSSSNSVISNINEELKIKLKNLNNKTFSLTINENNLFKNIDYSKPFKLLNNKKNTKILNHQFETIVFNCWGFLDHHTRGRNAIKKTEA